jgi:uncharacterized damage-inducible protein DinB
MRATELRRILSLAALAVLALAPAASAQSVTLTSELRRDWVDLKATMHALAEAMPEDRYTFKATSGQRDFGQQVVHVANANVLNLRFLGGRAAPPVVDRTATSKAEAIRAMDASFDYGTALIDELTDDTLLQVVQTNAFLGPSARARVIWFLLGHTWDIYGQMVVYLRLNGAVPPASQRP